MYIECLDVSPSVICCIAGVVGAVICAKNLAGTKGIDKKRQVRYNKGTSKAKRSK